MLRPTEDGFSRYMGRFFESVRTMIQWNPGLSTPGLNDFANRDLSRSIVWVPSRMVDSVEDMLDSWRRNENRDGVPSTTAMLPVMFVATAKDITSTEPAYGQGAADWVDMRFPGDPHNRYFQVQTVKYDLRAQVAIAAAEKHSADVLAGLFAMRWLRSGQNRRYHVAYAWQGIPAGEWPVMIDAPTPQISVVPTEQKNLTLLSVDLTLRANVPIFRGPSAGEPNDGQAALPRGFPTVQQVNAIDHDTP